MPVGRITWSGNDLDIMIGRRGMQYRYMQQRFQDRAFSGKIKQVNQHGIFEGSCDFYVTEDEFRALMAWFSYARQGQLFEISRDSSLVASTSLDGAAAAAQKVIPVTATTGFSVGDICLIRAEDADNEFELVKIASISAGVSVTATENLYYSYASGDTFRHELYFPSAIMLDNRFVPRKTDAGFYRYSLKFAETL